jgi:SAM-dependent methyltransferase
MIAWCQMNITSPHSNFHFSHIDVFNSAYAEAGGKLDAAQFRFPFEEHLFDIVFAKSVFTHLLPKEAENYLAQISRVLKKGGRAIVTFFLLNKKSSEAIRSRKSTLRFKHTFGPSLSISKKNPERALCYQEKFIFNLFRKYRLRLKRPYSRGTWPHLTTPQANYQDILIAVKF